MSGLITVVFMSSLLGLASFGIGSLPLSFTFSKTRLNVLSALGTGLLLGAALGVIIPEGIETLAAASPSSEIPTSKIALSLLSGFTFMFIVEQFLSGHAHSHSASESSPSLSQPISLQPTNSPRQVTKPNRNSPLASLESTHDVEFDVALNDLESDQGISHTIDTDMRLEFQDERAATNGSKAYPLTLGLVIHSLADGLALGASALPQASENAPSSQLSLVVFLALIIHKAPTALALTMSLLSTSLPRSECRKHIAFFSASTPLGALMSFGILRLLGGGADGDWTGIALLISGGTFLFVATVLQPVSHHRNPSNNDLGEKLRAALVILGIFLPFFIGATIGHHDHGQSREAIGSHA